MRKTFTTIAFAALLGTLAVSCQKETIINKASIVSENSLEYTVQQGAL